MSEEATPENDLLKRIAGGDEKAFRLIFEQYKEPFYAASLKMTRSAHTATEIVQEVFVALWLHRTALERVESPSSYFFAILYNQINKHFRRLARERRLLEDIRDQAANRQEHTTDALAFKENEQLLEEIIRQLPPQQKLVYQMSAQQGLSREEIAGHLNISPHTVKNHLLKAAKYVRSHFARLLTVIFF